MDYEKKYKEALERAKDCHVNKKFSELDDNAQELCEYIFPELKENDEVIRKELISLFQDCIDHKKHLYNVSDSRRWIAWLEKQDPKKFEEELEKAYKFADEVQYRKGYEDAKREIEKRGEESDYNPYKATIESISAMVEKYANNGDLRDFYDNIKVKCKDAMEYDNTWLEKQGVESPSGMKTIGESLGFTTQDECDKYHQIVSDSIVSDSDEVKPKYKVGDWVTDGEYSWLIVDIKSPDYILTTEDGGVINISISFLDNYLHLWTIEDVKDGDILANNAGAIFINAGIGSDKERVTLDCYCYLSVQKDFIEERITTGSWFYKNEIKPATNKQRELLFSKMKEKGYEWNDERKELVLCCSGY